MTKQGQRKWRWGSGSLGVCRMSIDDSFKLIGGESADTVFAKWEGASYPTKKKKSGKEQEFLNNNKMPLCDIKNKMRWKK